MNVCLVPEKDIRVYSSPVESNELNGIFAGILKLGKS
jgi:hypothetical protein